MKKLLSILTVALLLAGVMAPAVFASGEENYSLVVTDIVPADSGNDISQELQTLIDNNPNRTIYFPDGEYLLSRPIRTPADPNKSVSLKLADFAVIKAAGDFPAGEAVIQLGGKDPYNTTRVNGSNYALEGGIIDGSNIANGVSINSGRETAIRNCSIKNTVIGIHIMYGANSGSSDSDIFGVNIIGTGKTDSVGILIEGFDNTLTNIRIGNTFTGVQIKSQGNILRNIHPLYTSDYTDYENSCGFLIEGGNNWLDYCYSDQYATGFRTTDNGCSKLHDCFCYWYSPREGTHTAIKADKKFNSKVTNFTAGFHSDAEKRVLLSVGEIGGTGSITNLDTSEEDLSDTVYKAYQADIGFAERLFASFVLWFNSIFAI